MTVDAVRERWGAGEPAVNAWIMRDDVAFATSLAESGFDGVVADLQHGRMTEASLEWFAVEIEAAGAVPMVRLRSTAPAEVMRVLDLGVRGVIAPMVGSAEEAAALVSAARYPPLGTRSYGPIAGAFGTGAAHVDEANRRVLVLAMIETADGLANVDAIAATPGLDALYVGPADLSLSLGLASFADLADPALLEALDGVVAAARRNGIVAGIHAPSAEKGVAMLERGFGFVTPVVDEDVDAASAADALARTRVSR